MVASLKFVFKTDQGSNRAGTDGVATRLRTGPPGILISTDGKDFALLYTIHPGSGAHPATQSMGTKAKAAVT